VIQDQGNFTTLIRWAGSKRLLVNRLVQFLPRKFRCYYEPMAGSGALFFYLQPQQAVMGDINHELINFYRVVKQQPCELYRTICRLPANKKTYLALREENPHSLLRRAVRFYYLIRLSWNGLYRVNRQGYFNVPFGGRRPITLLSREKTLSISKALTGARILCGDFMSTTASSKSGDFVYFDPPYPRGSYEGNGFARYSKTGFSLEEHKRLADYAARLADRDIHVMVTEAVRKEILKLYSRDFRMQIVRNASLIAADGDMRRDAYEAILTSYTVNNDI